MAHLKYLLIENYRGASTRFRLEFEPTKLVTLIFGENGTGKTTIADALDAIGNLSPGSLRDMSSTSPRRHIPTIGKSASDVTMELATETDTWSTTLTADNLSTTPAPWPRILVLRRSKIRRFIDAPPAERFAELRSFIDVENVERSEDALREVVRDVRRDYDESVRQQAEAESQLLRVWDAEGRPGPSQIEWARDVAQQDITQLAAVAASLRELDNDIRRTDAALNSFQLASQVVAERERAVEAAQRDAQTVAGGATDRELKLASILTDVREYLSPGEDPEQCPVCMQAIPLHGLQGALDARLQEHERHTRAATANEAAISSRNAAAAAASTAGAALVSSAARLYSNATNHPHEILQRLGITEEAYPLLSKQEGISVESIAEAEKLVSVLIPALGDINDAEQAATRLSGQVNSVREFERQVRESSLKSRELEALATALSEAYDVARLARLSFTQDILDEVTTECNRLYSSVHPGERIELSRLELDQRQRGSLLQSAKFEGHDNVVPQAYFSESHLDTLGFCYWLAIAKRENANRDAIVVLDDVFTSIDAPHLSRIAQMIAAEATNFAHVIITTHQRPWRDLYKYHRGPGASTQMIELQNWSLARGLSAYRTLLAIEELAATLEATPFDRQISCSKAGILLEATLDHLALQYRCRVARSHDGDYTLGELMDGTASLFRQLEVHRPDLDASGNPQSPPSYTASTDANAVMTELRGMAFLRNQVGAHYNAPAADISDADIRRFAELTVKLARELGCISCGQMPGRETGTHFRCSCSEPREIRLLPLRI